MADEFAVEKHGGAARLDVQLQSRGDVRCARMGRQVHAHNDGVNLARLDGEFLFEVVVTRLPDGDTMLAGEQQHFFVAL